MHNNSENKIVLTGFVIAFAAFIVAGLAVVPSLVQDVDAERKKPKKAKDHDITLDESLIELLKDGKIKDKKPKDN